MADLLTSSIYLIAMGVWLGGVVFFSFFTAPVISERLPRQQATELISLIFPRYYNLGYVCGSGMLLAGAYPLLSEPTLTSWTAEVIALVATGVSLYAGRVVMPRVRRLRNMATSSAGTPEHGINSDRYNRARQLSVTLNSAVLLLLLAETLLFAIRVRGDFVSS